MRTLFLAAFALFVSSAHAQIPASDLTRAANASLNAPLSRAEANEAALADKGFVATLEDPVIRRADGAVAFDLSAYDFAKGEAADTVHPGLWRHLTLLRKHGLYKVAPKIWQVRGFDMSVMSVIETNSGYVVVDPLTAKETAAAAMSLVYKHVGKRPIKAVIYTHSHGDHFGGVKGVVDPADVAAGKIDIIAPDGFLEEAVSENLIAGPAMSRRATYQFGSPLASGPEGQAGAGIGTRLPNGALTLIAPTKTIARTGESLTIDGLRIEFQVTPGTEAPAEMNFFLPDLKALCLAENANPTLHNILPPRGAQVRDAKAWADYLSEAQTLYGSRTDVLFVSHGWPRWGNREVNEFVSLHRDAYKYLHDQTVRLMNKGLTAPEIAEVVKLPAVLAEQPYNRGYYGTMAHNAKAVYQRYLGWYDANPVHLNPWPPEEAGKRYVEAMGGKRRALKLAKKALKAGDNRWAAEIASHLVFADAENQAAREVLANAFTQMGYQAEGMLWRNMYLVGAKEALQTPETPSLTTMAPDMIAALPSPAIFNLLAIRVNPDAAAGRDVSVSFVFPDRGERTRVTLRNSVLLHAPEAGDRSQATVTLPRPAFLAMLFAGASPETLMKNGTLKIEGDPAAVQALMTSLDAAAPATPFAIVTP